MDETSFQIQIGGELPHAVVATRQQFEDSPVEIFAVYGPVPTKERAQALAKALTDMGLTDADDLQIVPAYPVTLSDPAVANR